MAVISYIFVVGVIKLFNTYIAEELKGYILRVSGAISDPYES